jgi:hypothetical protein
VIVIELHLNNVKREDGCSLSRLWKALIHFLQERKKVLSRDKYFFLREQGSLKRQFFSIPFPSCYNNIVA